MYLSNLALIDYRSYEKAVVAFEPGVNCLVGANGYGKTNVVEAIGYLATLSSHRVSSDFALVRQGATAAVVQARLVTRARPRILEVEIYSGQANRARIDREAARPAELVGIVKSVLFAPEDLTLVRDEPRVRRRFLDEVMIQRRPKMARVKADYEKVLRQRGALLKSLAAQARRGLPFDAGSLEVWDVQLASLGGAIMAERASIIASMRPHLAAYYEKIAGEAKSARLDYQASADAGSWALPSPLEISQSAEAAEQIEAHEQLLSSPAECEKLLLTRIGEIREKEIGRGANLVGPHRDDMVISLATFPARGYASHGESWSLALALRLASWRLLAEGGDEPILVLDDVFAELDSLRRERLAAIAAEAEQVFVTAAVGEDLPTALAGATYRVEPGVIERAAEPGSDAADGGGESAGSGEARADGTGRDSADGGELESSGEAGGDAAETEASDD